MFLFDSVCFAVVGLGNEAVVEAKVKVHQPRLDLKQNVSDFSKKT